MPEDLYTQWLSIPPGPRPPDYYALLGLPPFTRQTWAIEEAARRQLDKLDRYAIHPDKAKRESCQRMMNEVAVARVTLTDPGRRRQYEQQVARERGVAVPPETVGSDADAFDLAEGDEAAAGEITDEATRAFLSSAPVTLGADVELAEPEKKTNLLLWGGLCALALLVVGLGVAYLLMTGGKEPVTEPGIAAAPVPAPPVEAQANPEELSGDFMDAFDRSDVGDRYESRSSAARLLIAEGQLVVASTDSDPVKLEVQPTLAGRRIRRAAMDLALASGVSAQIAVDEGARLMLSRTNNQVAVEAIPGRTVSTLVENGRLALEADIAGGTVTWRLNGQTVATSPDTRRRTGNQLPLLEVTTLGPAGGRAYLDNLRIWYERRR